MIARLAAAFAAICLLGLFLAGAYRYGHALDVIVASPNVYDIATLDAETRLQVGPDPNCASADTDCWATPEWDDRSWQVIDAPKQNLAPIFAEHDSKNAAVFYRIRFKVPREMAGLTDEIAFSPQYIQHRRYSVFVNGRFLFAGNGLSQTGDTLFQKVVVPLTHADLRRDTILVAIRGDLGPGTLGLHTTAAFIVGPASTLARLHTQVEQVSGSYLLLFLLSKGAVFVVLALFFLRTRPHPGLGFFLIYALAMTLENLVAGNFIEDVVSFKAKAIVYFTMKAAASAALFGFYQEMLGATTRRRWVAIYTAITAPPVVIATANFCWGTGALGVGGLNKLVNVGFIAGIAVALTQGFWRLRARAAPSSHRLSQLVMVTVVYLAILVWGFFVRTYNGYDVRAVVDLFFYFYVAYLSISEFAMTQIRVGTLAFSEDRLRSIVRSFIGERAGLELIEGAAGREREVALLHFDVRHFDSFVAKHALGDVATMFNELIEVIQLVVAPRRGEIVKIAGGTIVAAWGLGERRDTDTADAVMAALELRQALAELNGSRRKRGLEKVTSSMGVAAGSCYAGQIGTKERKDFAVLGAAAHLALALAEEANTQDVDILLDASAYEAVKSAALAERVSFRARRRSLPVACYKLVGIFDSEANLRIHSPMWESRFSTIRVPGLVVDAGSNQENMDYDRHRFARAS